MTTKLFISQPMVDKTDEEILEIRNAIIEKAKAKFGASVEIVDSFIEEAPDGAKPLWYLGKSLEFLSEADEAYFAEGWDKYRGCKMEHEACEQYGVHIWVD